MLGNYYWKLRDRAGKFYYQSCLPLVLKHRALSIGKKDKIEVVFFAINLAMWNYQRIYDFLSKDEHFNCHIVFTVPITFSVDQQDMDLKQMREYFTYKGIEYIDHKVNDEQGFDVKGLINPDILFYPQPYECIYPKNHEFLVFKDKLLCYIPYGIYITDDDSWQYDLKFHNLAWKIYCPFQQYRDKARKVARNRGKNWVVSGNDHLDRYLSPETTDMWKIKDRSVKRLIWAPHFTITKVTWIEPRSSFLWMSQLMLDIAEKNKDRLQIAFKPHPRLKSELYLHPDWGKEKTDQYYQCWESMQNTQLETGDFIDLFKASDAMIHDSGSFTIEYLFVNKPVAFTTTDFEALKSGHNEIARACLDQYYVVHDENELMAYIKDVVIAGQDTMKEKRTAFFQTSLKPNVKGNTSEFIVNDIKKSLGL